MNLFCAAVGSGAQLFTTTLCLLSMALLGVFAPSKRGSIVTACIVLYALCAGVGGFVSARLYRQLHGENWAWNIILATFLFPGGCCRHACTHTHTHTHAHARTPTYMRTHICAHTHMHAHTHMNMHTHAWTCTHTHTHTHMRAHQSYGRGVAPGCRVADGITRSVRLRLCCVHGCTCHGATRHYTTPLHHAITRHYATLCHTWHYTTLCHTRHYTPLHYTTLHPAGPLLGIFSFLNTVAIANSSTAALPFGTIVIVLALFLLVNLPLTVLGGVAGRNIATNFKSPCRTTKVGGVGGRGVG